MRKLDKGVVVFSSISLNDLRVTVYVHQQESVTYLEVIKSKINYAMCIFLIYAMYFYINRKNYKA